MKSVLFFFLLLFVFSCNSVRQNNLFLQKKIPASELREDVDFTYKKLKRFHPNLYWYISKPQLDKKFDSLKKIITEPLTPNQFYLKLSPVIASIKEGHLRLRTFPRQYSKSEQKELKTKKPLFAMMDYKIIDNRMFVTDNKQNFGNIKPGTEILTINNENISDLTERYRRLFSSDGYNKTFQKYFINLTFFNYYTLENGFLDSAKLLTKLDNKVSEIIIRRQKKTEQELTKEKVQPKVTSFQKIQDYDFDSKSYNRSLKFLSSDSSIAYIKIKTFSATLSKAFYSESFSKIRKAGSAYLILDIRDNLGGSLSEINTLYSYLSDKKFTLIKVPEMTSKTSGMHQNYFRGQTVFSSIFMAIGYPFFLAGNYLMSFKKDQNYYFREFVSRPTRPKANAFKGKIYVLVNGASFSASSIISSKLKYEKRAVIVGEETGGANDGTVSGVNNTVTLPNSKLTLPIGLFLIRPNIQFENKGLGVIPNFYVDPDFANIRSSEDKILKWVLDDIDFRKSVNEKMNNP